MRKSRNKFIIILFITTVLVANAMGQRVGTRTYVLLTFEHSFKVGPHGVKKYNWIIPADSITSFESSLSRIFLRGFSKGDLDSCMLGRPVDPYFDNPNLDFDLDENYISIVENLETLIKKNRLKVQTIVKKWGRKKVERIEVYATEITGDLCHSKVGDVLRYRFNYDGVIYLPQSSFKASSVFLHEKNAKFILYRDFTRFDFAKLPNL